MTFFLVIILLSCVDKNQKREAVASEVKTEETIQPELKYDELRGVVLEVMDVAISDQEKVLKVKFKNTTDSTFTAGEEYSIMAWTGREWVTVATEEDIIFNDIGYNLTAGSDFKNSYKLSIVYPDLQNGTYLFTTTLLLVRQPGDYDEFKESV
ncbi:MAG: immunoglobulin-like domain-containing protein, partial [Cyclobacteriaceae bacterium]